MEVFVLVAVALLALGIITVKIRQVIRGLTQDESGDCSSCNSCSTFSCQENLNTDTYHRKQV